MLCARERATAGCWTRWLGVDTRWLEALSRRGGMDQRQAFIHRDIHRV